MYQFLSLIAATVSTVANLFSGDIIFVYSGAFYLGVSFICGAIERGNKNVK